MKLVTAILACIFLSAVVIAGGNQADCCLIIGPNAGDDIGWFLYTPPDVSIQCHLALLTYTENLDPNYTGWGWEVNGCSSDSADCCCGTISPGPFCADNGAGGGTNTPTDVYTDSYTDGCGPTVTLSRLWRSNSQCNNAYITNNQIVTMVDTIPPTMAIPADLEYECPPIVPDTTSDFEMDNYFGSPDVIDFCTVLTDNNIVQAATTPDGTGTFTRTFTVSDGCNPDPVFTQTITLIDTTPPLIERLPNQYFECTGVTPVTGPPGVSDLCYRSGALTATSLPDTIYQGTCPGKYSIVRSWSASDADGNTVFETQVIIVDDTTPPTISPAVANTVNIYSVNCFSDITTPYTQDDLPTGCGGVAVTAVPFDVSLAHNEDEGRTEVLIKYTSSDLCGNSESWADLWQVNSGVGVFSDVISGPTAPVDKGTVFTITIDVTATNACSPFGILLVDAGYASLVSASSSSCFFQAATGVIYCDPVPTTAPSTLTLDLIMPTDYLGSDLLISITWHYNYRTIGVEIGSYLVSFN